MREDKLVHIPEKPGVYLLKGQKEKILYVGKAKNLKKRLMTYFQRPEALDMRKASMVKLIVDFSYIITENELEALVLEASLIKQYKPRFNIVLRDDKNYPYLKLTIGEDWPRLEVVRRIERDNSLYFGPYVPAQGMWDALAFIRKNFPIRLCDYALGKPMRPCIQYQMGRCGAPCDGRISRVAYKKTVEEVILFLRGKRVELLNNLERKMHLLSRELKFEEAARIRDRIKNIKLAWESQRVVAPELGDIDAIGFYSDGIDAALDVFFVRNGVLIGTKDFYLKDAGKSRRGEVLHGFIEMFYAGDIIPPEEIITASKTDNRASLEAWLRQKRGKKVGLRVPKTGKKFDLPKMADENAKQLFQLKNVAQGDEDEIVTGIKDRLGLPFLPQDIGAFDVSTIAGSESVGAFIYWSHGEFKKDLYRHLRIKTVSGVDDYSMMHEVITRTLKNLGDETPNLIVIDGGKGQLEIASDVIEANKITGRDGKRPVLIAVAKDPDRALTLAGEVVDLEDGSPSSLLLKKIRDEAHRFAVAYHRKLRDKRLIESPLEKISGIGRKRRLELLRYFGSIDDIGNATVEEIAKIHGFNRRIASILLEALRRHE
ncbi:MAG TPA: excinuclease ABC subunit UvrC [Thermodesulfovibrionales bacterium]|nr:excinuclease ABC subunit UvrC [Thermodesulfovibrionales bacterium]